MQKLIAAIFLTLIAFAPIGCKKDPEPTVAVITVVDIQNRPVANAEVRLFGKASGPVPIEGERIDFTNNTNAQGVVRFELSQFYQAGQTGFAVLDIRARRGVLEGTNIIRVNEEQVNEATVKIQ